MTNLNLRPIGDSDSEYRAMREDVGVADLSAHTIVELTGGDAATFLHNMCTADINRLAAGGGCEFFLTNVKGKTIAFGLALRRAGSIVLHSAPGQAETIVAHLDRYIIREDVELHDRGDQWGVLLFAGPNSAAVMTDLFHVEPPASVLQHVEANVETGATVNICRTDWFGPDGFLVHADRAFLDSILRGLSSVAGACGGETVTALRIEAGTPLFGADITDDNFPQEVGRNKRAISFTKGCYLGQETVARIDALGHVNRTLCGVQFDEPTVPDAGAELFAGQAAGAAIGHVTSATFSPAIEAPLALAYLRRGHTQPGTELQSEVGAARVVELPLDAPQPPQSPSNRPRALT